MLIVSRRGISLADANGQPFHPANTADDFFEGYRRAHEICDRAALIADCGWDDPAVARWRKAMRTMNEAYDLQEQEGGYDTSPFWTFVEASRQLIAARAAASTRESDAGDRAGGK